MAGWIKLHRQIMEHWIWEDPKRFKWWMEMLLLTNHTDKKMIIGGNLITIKRGSFHTSEVKLSERWEVSRNTVRRFLKLLECDEMITTKKTKNGTTVFVHNYAIYQGKDEIKKQQTEQQNEQQAEQCNEQQCEQKKDNSLNRRVNTNKNVKNEKNYKNVKNEKKEKNSSAFDFFQDNGFGFITQYTYEDINYYLDSFNQDADQIVIAALKIAKDRNKVNWGYAKSILNGWLQTNLQGIDKVRAYELQQSEMRKRRNAPIPHQSKELTPKWLENKESIKNDKEKNLDTDKSFQNKVAAFKRKLNEKWE